MAGQVSLYCPQSFSGGGLYLKGSWLLWSMYDGLLWSVYDGLLRSMKNGLLWYMGHTSKCQICTHDDHNLTVAGCTRPQSFSGGGLYLNVNWLLWSVYDWLL